MRQAENVDYKRANREAVRKSREVRREAADKDELRRVEAHVRYVLRERRDFRDED
jgi:hypothetical protein